MPEEMVLRLAKQTLETVLLVSSPMLGAGLVVGVLISIVQIITSIHDTALAFVPRIVVTFVIFERWFLVPLPKGPLEAWLGY